MSNVLPEEAKEAVWRMYRARFLIAGSLVMLAVALLAALSLFPSYVILQTEQGGVAAEAGSGTATAQADRIAVAHAQGLLTTLTPILSATTTPTAAIADALAARPIGISIDHITMTTGATGSMIVSGTAATIEAINRYQNALRADKRFTGISVPVGELAGTAGGHFSITLSGKF